MRIWRSAVTPLLECGAAAALSYRTVVRYANFADVPRSSQAPANNPSAFAMSTPSPSQIEKTALDHVWFHVSTRESLTSPSGMMVFESGEGCYLTDIHGR